MRWMISAAMAGTAAIAATGYSNAAEAAGPACYTGSDPTYSTLTTTDIQNGVQGTDFVNTAVLNVDNGAPGNRSFNTGGLNFHTIGTSVIPHASECAWTRWYQTEGYIQGFRLFDGEENRSGSSNTSPRTEAFASIAGWDGDVPAGRTFEWTGRMQIGEAEEAAIFQLKQNSANDWAVHLRMNPAGQLWIKPRGQPPVLVGTPGTSTPFGVTVTDNGRDWTMRVVIGGGTPVIVSGTRDWTNQPTAANQFRWGVYKDGYRISDDSFGNKAPSSGSRLFVSGARWREQ